MVSRQDDCYFAKIGLHRASKGTYNGYSFTPDFGSVEGGVEGSLYIRLRTCSILHTIERLCRILQRLQTEKRVTIMKTLSLLALLVGAVAIAEGYPSEEKHVDIANSRQKREMPEGYGDMEGDMKDMFGPPPGGVVVMVQQIVDSPDCCKTKSCGDMKKCKYGDMEEEMEEIVVIEELEEEVVVEVEE
ncbi:uncharacterized protein LOC122260624 [Penaeus japonicus]|uniref:uncharacterized protein LOC122260624 n=1 Tax=Penaeus japonicus TaxID=27405 RepID=UPI001C70D037|nr:uncharacterized protein LOC122260624 [Penaeus japonicus]